jgi:hypothetical protein
MRRSRKPVWAVSSIEGSNPSLSVPQPVFPRLSRHNNGSRTDAVGRARGSTQASVGPTLRGFVPSTFPPDAVAFVHIKQATGGFQHALEPRIGEQRRSFVGEQSTLARTSADRQMFTAGRGGRPFQEVVG